jgi:hypothetical protein
VGKEDSDRHRDCVHAEKHSVVAMRIEWLKASWIRFTGQRLQNYCESFRRHF